jgi:hypothetical protein
MSDTQDPNQAPNWAFSPDHEIKCPECGATLAGLNWVLDDADTLTGMALVPCGHQLPTSVWELSFQGRDRKYGTVIRTPRFQRKDGS